MASGTTGRTPSPGERHDSLSPNNDAPHMPFSTRQRPSLYIPNDSCSLPPHMRAGLQQPSPRSSPTGSSPTLSAFGSNNWTHRPSLTSHPLLPVLEPPTYHDFRQSGTGNSSPLSPHSPHGGNMGWQSPAAAGLPSPGHSDSSYMYPDTLYSANQHLYYPNSNIRRQQSSEPDHYELARPRLPTNGGIWAASMG